MSVRPAVWTVSPNPLITLTDWYSLTAEILKSEIVKIKATSKWMAKKWKRTFLSHPRMVQRTHDWKILTFEMSSLTNSEIKLRKKGVYYKLWCYIYIFQIFCLLFCLVVVVLANNGNRSTWHSSHCITSSRPSYQPHTYIRIYRLIISTALLGCSLSFKFLFLFSLTPAVCYLRDSFSDPIILLAALTSK